MSSLESVNANQGIIYEILTFRAHQACCSIYICFVPEENYLKRLIESTFIIKTKNCQIHFFCYFRVTLHKYVCWMQCFVLLFLSISPFPQPLGGTQEFKGWYSQISEHYSGGKWMCRKPCSIALYVMYIRNKDCILFKFSQLLSVMCLPPSGHV